MNLKPILVGLLLCATIVLMCAMPAMAAEDDSAENEELESENVIDYKDWFDPKGSVDEVETSPIGNPLKKFINLVIGLVILYGAGTIVKSWIKSNSDDGETASDGFLGMGSKAVGALVMVACIALYFYFLGYKL